MSLVTIILVIVVVGMLLWAINNYVPMAAGVRSILNAVVVILLIIWLLQSLGVIHHLLNIRVGSLAEFARGRFV
jgi:hypothetical protein